MEQAEKVISISRDNSPNATLAFSWFWNDLSKTHLLWIKLIFFFQSGSLVVLYPYLVIHMRSLGLSVEEGGEKVLRKNLVNIIYHCRWLSSMESSRSPILLDHPWQDSWLIRLEISGDFAERETGD